MFIEVRPTSLLQSTLSDVRSAALPPRDGDSPASSLAPSDSASQLSQPSKIDPATQLAIDKLLCSVEGPSVRPPFLPPTVMWYFEDCATDKTYGDILTEANKSRPRMGIAIRRENGTSIPPHHFTNMRIFSDLVVRRLIERFGPDSRARGVKSLTKSIFKSLFHAEYRQAILELEADEPLLRLCARHWKAEVMLSQAFLKHGGDVEGKPARGRSVAPTALSSSDENAPQRREPLPAAPIPKLGDVRVVAPMNTSKRAFELSPGPKSPSASHAQKRTKDDATLPGQQTSSSLVPAGK